MPQHTGIVGCPAEGAALCYRTICTEGVQLLGHTPTPEVSILISDANSALPTLDSTRLLARAALQRAVSA